MRIALYDSIVESHVVKSLARSFAARGHEVHETGKIGHGFEFPSGRGQIRRLELALVDVLDFEPDWILVFRPASLPPDLIARVKRRGINLAVWLSDDPVLYDLSYGPVLDSYDLVLHCGSASVLRFYEHEFGRPTGVNMPFWTDHEAFPYVWGTEPTSSDALFLGNVHDEVRRARYFDLASLRTSVAVHGRTGNDYYGLGGGYLDSDAEVVAAGARTRVAISVPQFFENHRGLRTWFPGLDALGYFEFPSRIIQYMAMGLPVINVVPGRPSFPSFPEMIVCDDFKEVDRRLEELIKSQETLARISDETHARFDRHFSATSRVMMFEDLTQNDEWRRAPLSERAAWFTKYDATMESQGSCSEGEPHPLPRGQGSADVTTLRDTINIGLIGLRDEEPLSRYATMERAIVNSDKFTLVNLGGDSGPVVSDLDHLGEAIDIDYHRRDGLDVVFVLSTADERDADISRECEERSIPAIYIDDSRSTGVKRLQCLSRQFAAVGTISPRTVEVAVTLGLQNVYLFPYSVDAVFLEKVAAVESSRMGSRWRHDAQAEEASAPAIEADLRISPQVWEELSGLSLDEVASQLKSRVGIMSFAGTSREPHVPPAAPFLVAASDFVVMPRFAGTTEAACFASLAVQVEEPGEAALKLEHLARSSLLEAHYSGAKTEALETVLSAEANIEKILSQVLPGKRRKSHTTEGEISLPDGRHQVPLSEYVNSDQTQAVVLGLGVSSSETSVCDASVLQIMRRGDVVWESSILEMPSEVLVSWRTHAQLAELSLRIRAVTPDSLVGNERVTVSVEPKRQALIPRSAPDIFVTTRGATKVIR